jgi:hypothetical protein
VRRVDERLGALHERVEGEYAVATAADLREQLVEQVGEPARARGRERVAAAEQRRPRRRVVLGGCLL